MNRYKVAVFMDASRAYDRDVLKGITYYNKLLNKFNFFFYTPKYIHVRNEDKLINRLLDWKPDGIITREINELESILSLGVPTIISPHIHIYNNQVNLWCDNLNIGELAASYFLSRGYKNFGYFGFEKYQWSVERQEGFCNALKAFDSINSFLFDFNNFLWEELPEKLEKWLHSLQKPCAIFSATDELNIHLLEAAKKTDYKVPDDLLILGVDNDELICEMSRPTLSSIDQNAYKAGYEVANALYTWLNSSVVPSNIIIKPKGVITRHSTSALAIDDAQVRKALNYINTYAISSSINVDQVVNVTNQSRRILEKKFKNLLQSSIMEEIRKVRIERIKDLLINSDLTVQQIALQLNFDAPENVARYFKNGTGFNPLEFRKKYQVNKRN